MAFGFIAIGVLYMIWYVVRFWTGHRYIVVVGPESILLVRKRRVIRTFAWRDIVKIDRGPRSVEIHSRYDDNMFSITETELGSAARLTQLYDAAVAMHERVSQGD